MEGTDEIIIENEKQAWNLLRQVIDNKIPEGAQIKFEGWPVFKITIEGKDFDGSIPTRIMPPLLDLQKEIYRIYCQAKYNTEDIRGLKNEERELLEIVVVVDNGSSIFSADLGSALTDIIGASNMSGTEVLILLLGIGFYTTTHLAWKTWIRSKERMHGQDVSVKLSEEETKRHELLIKATQQSPQLNNRKEAISNVKNHLAKKLKSNDNLKVGDIKIIDGTRAAEIIPPPRQEPEEVRIDGTFIINEIKFPRLYGEKYRLSITNIHKDQHFIADASPRALSGKQIKILKNGGFGVKKVQMEINARLKNDVISAAKVVSINWPE